MNSIDNPPSDPDGLRRAALPMAGIFMIVAIVAGGLALRMAYVAYAGTACHTGRAIDWAVMAIMAGIALYAAWNGLQGLRRGGVFLKARTFDGVAPSA